MRRFWMLAAVLAMAFGAPAWAQTATGSLPATGSVTAPATPAKPEQKIKVVDIAVRGNRVVSTDTILLSIPIRAGEEVTQKQVQESLERIYGLGYFTPDLRVATEPAFGGVRLVFYVTENPTLNKITVQGNTILATASIQDTFKPQVGRIINYRDVQKAIKDIETRYAEKGYVLARVSDVQLAKDGTLELKVSEGVIDSVKISGLEETQDYVVRRELTLKPGQVFNFNQMSDDLRRVYNLNFFEDIGLKYEPGAGDKVVVVVNLKEKQTGSFQLSAGWSTRDGPLGMLSLRKDNFLGRAQSLSTDVTVGGLFDPTRRNVTAELNYFNPWIDQEHTSLGVSGYARRYNNFYGIIPNSTNRGFIEDRRGGMLSLGRPLFGDPVTTNWHGSVRFKGERIGIFQSDTNWLAPISPLPAVSATQTGWDTAYSMAFSLNHDTRDFVLNPTRGWFNNYTVEQYLPFGDLHFTRLQADLNRYLPIPYIKDHTFAVGLKAGTNFGTSGNIIPSYEQFYSTGNYLIRGWDEAKFSGNSFSLLSAEWRFPIVNILSGVVFADTGIFWDQTQQAFNLNQARSGYGVGIRVNTPMGPLRLDLGYSRYNNEGGAGVIKPHFSIGQKF